MGRQLCIAVTKRLSDKITTHTNAGYTYIVRADHYRYESNGMPASAYERDITSVNLGASLVWLAKQKMHLLAEYVFSYGKTAKDDGSLSGNCLVTVNPGVRYAFDIGKVQIVPGVGVPLNFSNGVFDNAGTFLYLSVEPCLMAAQAFHEAASAGLAGADPGGTPAGTLKKDELATFFIGVSPLISITEDGNHPLIFIVQDIAALGTSSVKVTKKQTFEIERWDIFLSTTTSQEELESYFIFVENETGATFTKLATGDLFEQPEFVQYLKSAGSRPVDLDELRSICDRRCVSKGSI